MAAINRDFIEQLTQLQYAVDTGILDDPQSLNARIAIAFATVEANADEFGDQAEAIMERLRGMQDRLEARALPPAEAAIEPVTEEAIRNTLYNGTLEEGLQNAESICENLLERSVARTLIELAARSTDVQGIICENGQELTVETCPDLYIALFSVLHSTKELVSGKDSELLKTMMLSEEMDEIGQEIYGYAIDLVACEEMQDIFSQLREIIKPSRQNVPAADAPANSFEVSHESLAGVTDADVSEYVYALIAKVAQPRENLAYTVIINAIVESRVYKNALNLGNDKAVTLESYSGMYKTIIKAILDLKSTIGSLSQEQIEQLRTLASGNQAANPGLLAVSAKLLRAAREISALDSFKEIVARG